MTEKHENEPKPASASRQVAKKKVAAPRRDRIHVSLAPGVRKLLRAYLASENGKPAHAGKKLSRSDVLGLALADFIRSLKRVPRERTSSADLTE